MGWSRDTIRKVAKRTGYPVVEAWSSHNAGTMGTIYGPMLHHTGTPYTASGDYPTLKVVRDGRPGLENSLCMFGLGRSGTIYLINDKISWHAGVGDWRGVTDGNGHFAGIEAEGPYPSGEWPDAEVDAYKRLVASILLECGRGIEWAPTHAQWANPPGRKTDPIGVSMSGFMSSVQNYLENPAMLGKEEDDLKEDERAWLARLNRIFSEEVVNGKTFWDATRAMERRSEEVTLLVRGISAKVNALDTSVELTDEDVVALADAVAARLSADQASVFVDTLSARLQS